ncbi:MAG: DUF2510 domain-containing protein [Actinomycetota bacterium]|nr:DUF2510 domain-containing protein [Actinomycetota bacterium]
MAGAELLILLFFVLIGPVLCALIAQARGIEWWLGALIGFASCIGLVVVCLIKPGPRTGDIPPPPAGARWVADPTRRHELRLWDGTQWTANVTDRGQSGWDPMT